MVVVIATSWQSRHETERAAAFDRSRFAGGPADLGDSLAENPVKSRGSASPSFDGFALRQRYSFSFCAMLRAGKNCSR